MLATFFANLICLLKEMDLVMTEEIKFVLLISFSYEKAQKKLPFQAALFIKS